LSKFIVASLASALALTAVSSVLADPDPAPAATPPAQSSAAPADQATQMPAPAAQPAPAPIAKKKGPSPDDVICKPDTETDSRLGGKKICLTREEWKTR
jgi:hypothetical protein